MIIQRGYGRIVRDEGGNVKGIVEEKDTSDEQKFIKESTQEFTVLILKHY